MTRTKKSRRPSCKHRWSTIGWHFVPGFGVDKSRCRRECNRCGDVLVMPVRGDDHAQDVAAADRTEMVMRAADAARVQRGEPLDEATLPQRG